MDYAHPHGVLEPLEREIAVVDEALAVLVDEGVLPHTRYDHGKMLAHRRAVAQEFEIPWTAITPRMQRLLYAVNAILQPRRMIAAGVFCGNTFISNAGAAVGPGACYRALDLVGVEIDAAEAARARRNVGRIGPTGVARIVAEDATRTMTVLDEPIDLVYLDADGAGGRGKGIYLDILLAGYAKIPPGGVVIAHNSVNSAGALVNYFDFVRNHANFRASVNVIIDPEGIEVSVR